MESNSKICFVIMGFGKKTDFSSGRTLDLDQTYKNIIRPAVKSCGYECVRADEIQDSGLIDKSMYALLMRSDLVIADISTYNPNAIYELGIRHAVKPFSTIIIKEKQGNIPFDLDHTKIFQYSHLGEDIGVDESIRCQNELSSLISNIANISHIDSPLYEYIKDISPPIIPEQEYESIIGDLARREKHIFAIVELALMQMAKSNFLDAYMNWEKASNLVPSETYFIQQHALCRYKSKSPSENTSLIDALNIINKLDPDNNTNDPETLGITGAIYKNLWLLESDIEYLNRAIYYYGKGFNVRNDYYTGENYALCLTMKEKEEGDKEEQIYYKVEAKKTREKIVRHLEAEIFSESVAKRSDEKWIYATLSQCYRALGNIEKANYYEKMFMNIKGLLDWEKETFNNTKKLL